MNAQRPFEGHTVRLPSRQEPAWSPSRRRASLGLLLIVVGGSLLLLTLSGRIEGTFLNIGRVEGTVVGTERFSARHVVLDVESEHVTLVRGTGSEVVVEVTRHGFGITERGGHTAAYRLSMPTIVEDGDTIRVTEHDRPGVNVSIFGRLPYRHYNITVPRDGDVHIETAGGAIIAGGLSGNIDVAPRTEQAWLARVSAVSVQLSVPGSRR